MIFGNYGHRAWPEERAKSNGLERTAGLADAGARPRRSVAV